MASGMLKGLVVLGALGAAWYVNGPGSSSAKSSDGVIEYGASDMTMNDAQNKAQDSLPQFLEHALNAEGMAADGAMVKVAFPVTINGVSGVEVIWVGPFAYIDSVFKGSLANHPRDIEANAGDTMEFTQDMVRDWMIRGSDGLLYGNYTTRVMLSDMSETEANQIRQVLAPKPVPAGW